MEVDIEIVGVAILGVLLKCTDNMAFVAVLACNRYLEYWLYLCRGIDGKTTFPWQKCCTSVGFDHRSFGYTLHGNHFWGMYSTDFSCPHGLAQDKNGSTQSGPLIRGLMIQVRNDKASKYLMDMRKRDPIPFSQKFPTVDQLALRLLERLLAFDPKDRPTAEEVCTTYS